MFAAVEDDLQVQAVPGRFGEQPLQVALGLHNAAARGQFPALGESVDVGVDRKTWHAKGLGHDHLGGFVADPRQFLQRLQIGRHFAAMLGDEDFREPADGARLLRPEPAGPNHGLDRLDRHPGQRLRGATEGE